MRKSHPMNVQRRPKNLPLAPPRLAMSSPSFGDDEVYFGSVRVAFAKVPGTVVSFKSSEWRVDPASLPAVLERAKLQVSMGPSSTNFLWATTAPSPAACAFLPVSLHE
jgi:hypothetical protein